MSFLYRVALLTDPTVRLQALYSLSVLTTLNPLFKAAKVACYLNYAPFMPYPYKLTFSSFDTVDDKTS